MINIRLGAFHNVVAVAATEFSVSILEKDGYENIINIIPDRQEGITISGEFGDISKARCGAPVPGMKLTRVTEVAVEELEDCHRLLLLRSSHGITLTWILHCEEDLKNAA